MEFRIEWDPKKAASNKRKHGISFDLASQVFGDPLVQLVEDRAVRGEQRWKAIGLADQVLLLLVVVHTVEEREADGSPELIRIISARKAEKQERRRYEYEDGPY